MFPFWDPVVSPLVLASKAKRIVEIGALRGETTALMLESLGADAELHVIDPVPEFDPAEHEAEFPGQYIFHRALSLDVLPTAGAFDVALIDGDHNWYTVYNELKQLAAGARQAEQPLPLLVMHDVGWPYGRRDLYYAPEQIPEEFRQPYAVKGMAPNRKKLLDEGGMNTTLANAALEGGERNGVRTALDDFVAEHDRPIRQVIIPLYYGLAIAAEHDYLAEHPEIEAMLDRLESNEGRAELLELSEKIRIGETVFNHNYLRMHGEWIDEANGRYLRAMRVALADQGADANSLAVVDAAVRAAYRATQGDIAAIGISDGREVYLRALLDGLRNDSASVFVSNPRSLDTFAHYELADERVNVLEGDDPGSQIAGVGSHLAVLWLGPGVDVDAVVGAAASRIHPGSVVLVDGGGPERAHAVANHVPGAIEHEATGSGITVLQVAAT
ncbi:MAG: class I SAM-dependent methyltransferase [Acidimicrobiales bacterium]|nr:class I SAM-dependent methyltransferase [Acidimicrobiales bacterium]